MKYSNNTAGIGFSLAEVIVCLGLLGLVLLTIAGLVTSSLSLQDKGGEQVVAAHLAEAELNKYKARPYQEIEAFIASPPAPIMRSVESKDYNCTLVVSRLSDEGALRPTLPSTLNLDSLKPILRLTLKIDWQENTSLGQGGTRIKRPASLELYSLISPGGTI